MFTISLINFWIKDEIVNFPKPLLYISLLKLIKPYINTKHKQCDQSDLCGMLRASKCSEITLSIYPTMHFFPPHPNCHLIAFNPIFPLSKLSPWQQLTVTTVSCVKLRARVIPNGERHGNTPPHLHQTTAHTEMTWQCCQFTCILTAMTTELSSRSNSFRTINFFSVRLHNLRDRQIERERELFTSLHR